MTKLTLTEQIVAGYNREEIAQDLNMDELDVADAETKVNKALEDRSVSEAEFQKICDEIDAKYEA